MDSTNVPRMVRSKEFLFGICAQVRFNRFSASNSSKLYKMAFADQEYLQQDEWQFGSKLSVEHVWDAFTIVSLLKSKEQCGEVLEVTHIGEQKDRFTKAMEERNRKLILEGQPDAVHHMCDGCFITYVDDNGDSSELKYPSLDLMIYVRIS